MHNRHVKFGWKILNRFGKIATSPRGGGIFWLTLYTVISYSFTDVIDEHRLYYTSKVCVDIASSIYLFYGLSILVIKGSLYEHNSLTLVWSVIFAFWLDSDIIASPKINKYIGYTYDRMMNIVSKSYVGQHLCICIYELWYDLWNLWRFTNLIFTLTLNPTNPQYRKQA